MKNPSQFHGTPRKRGGQVAVRKTWAKMACGCPVVVDTEERRHLIESCAFFQAARFRDVAPGRYRKRDLERAATEIDAVLRRHGIGGPKPLGRRTSGAKTR